MGFIQYVIPIDLGAHPDHPIVVPPTKPGAPPRPDQGLPSQPARPDNELPAYPDRPIVYPPTAPPYRPTHPIYNPEYPDNTLPSGGGGKPDQGLPSGGAKPSNPIALPPDDGKFYVLVFVPGVGWEWKEYTDTPSTGVPQPK